MSLTMDDLIGVCPNCSGTGKKPQESTGGRQTVTYIAGADANDCGRCAGKGRWGLTDTGKTIGEFLDIYKELKKRGLDG